MKDALHHLAAVIDGIDPPQDAAAAAALSARILTLFGEAVADAFELIPGLRSLSLFSPPLREALLSLPEGQDPPLLARALRLIQETSSAAGAALLLLGSPLGLPLTLRRESESPRPPGDVTVNVFLNYSGREEIVAAARLCLESNLKADLDEDAFASRLLTAGQPDPDLILLAGGPLEPKDFLLWQSSYAEIWHTAQGGLTYSRKTLLLALDDFQARQRRFGTV